jgi:hypothetical protein
MLRTENEEADSMAAISRGVMRLEEDDPLAWVLAVAPAGTVTDWEVAEEADVAEEAED